MNTVELITRYTQENIHFQRGPNYFDDLVECVKVLKKAQHPWEMMLDVQRPTTRSLETILDSGIQDVIEQGTGLKIDLVVSHQDIINASMSYESISSNNPVMNLSRRTPMDARGMGSRIREYQRAFEGGIDLVTGRVKGDLTEERATLMITQGLLSEDITAEEAAAVICHEIGHRINYFIYLGRIQTLTAVASDIVRIFNDNLPKKVKVEIMGVIGEETYVQGIDPAAFAEAKSGQTASSLYMSSAIRSPVSIYDSGAYDLRNFEAMADQYVARLGAGRHLTSLLRKSNSSKTFSFRSNFIFMVLLAILNSGTTVSVATRAGGAVGALDPEGKYDPPEARIRRIRRDIVQSIKGARTDDERRLIEESIKSIDEDLEKVIKDPRLTRALRVVGGYDAASAEAKIKLMQELETLATNELYVSANRMRVAQSRR